jgi:hypothetical protein
MTKNTAGQKIGVQMVSAADGSAFTGSVTVEITGDAGTQGTGSVGSGACTHEGNGYHTYAPSQAETNYDLIAFTFHGTGAIPVTVQVFTTGYTKSAAQIPANVTQFGGANGTFASGRPEVNTTHWNGTAVAAPATAGYPAVTVKVGTGTGEINLSSGAVPAKGNVKKNTAFSGFMFMMTDSSGHAPATGKTVTVTRAIDGGSFASGTLGSVTEVGNGIYAVDFGAGDLNGNTIILRATATGCDDTFVRIITDVA